VSAVAAPPRPAQLPLGPERQPPETRAPERATRHSHGGGRLTLEQRLERVWEGLFAAGEAACPLCGGAMEREGSGGRCSDCGTRLS
jgi:succinate dehydrogenase/fumarate reductase flavoprotein subunit